jgi:hypothetical protein
MKWRIRQAPGRMLSWAIGIGSSGLRRHANPNLDISQKSFVAQILTLGCNSFSMTA